MPQITLTKVRKVAGSPRVYLHFSDEVILSFESAAAVKEWARSIDFDDEQAKLLLKQILVRWWLHRNPDGDNPNSIEGKRITISLDTAAPLVVDNG